MPRRHGKKVGPRPSHQLFLSQLITFRDEMTPAIHLFQAIDKGYNKSIYN